MITEAVTAGFYSPPHHGDVPKIQILTIEELFNGKRPQIPFVRASFKKAVKEDPSKQKQAALL
jgi:hypothetical protein